MIFYQTQKTFLNFCVILSLFLLAVFKFYPNFYEKFLEIFFSTKLNPFLGIVKWGCEITKKYPYIIGFCYGVCFLSFFLRFEYPDSDALFFINSVLLILRNVLFIPYIGVLGLLNWLSKTFYGLVERKVISEFELSAILTGNNQFSVFDRKLFPHLPFLSSKKKHYYQVVKQLTEPRQVLWVQL